MSVIDASPIGPFAARELRAHLRTHLAAAGLAGDHIERLVLAAWEAMVNVAEHGGGVPQCVVGRAGAGISLTILDPVGVAMPHPTGCTGQGPGGEIAQVSAQERGRGLALVTFGVKHAVVHHTVQGSRLDLASQREAGGRSGRDGH